MPFSFYGMVLLVHIVIRRQKMPTGILPNSFAPDLVMLSSPIHTYPDIPPRVTRCEVFASFPIVELPYPFAAGRKIQLPTTGILTCSGFLRLPPVCFRSGISPVPFIWSLQQRELLPTFTAFPFSFRKQMLFGSH